PAGAVDVVVGQVEPVRGGVDLDRGTGAGGGGEHGVEVDVDRRAPADQPAGGVADHVDVRVLAGPYQPTGHVRLGLGEVGVHRRHAQVEAGKELRRPVHPAV